MSRVTVSTRSVCQTTLWADGMWPRSNTPGSTETSTTRTFGLSRFFSSHSVVTTGPSDWADTANGAARPRAKASAASTLFLRMDVSPSTRFTFDLRNHHWFEELL